MKLEEALGEVLRQNFLLNLNHSPRKCHKTQDILFFPRKILRVKKSSIISNSWFIEERTDEKATKLQAPTELTSKALTSGLRSGIVLNNAGEYIKLKGIAPKIRRWKTHSGLCSPYEASAEQQWAYCLEYANFPFTPVKPKFIEAAPFPKIFLRSDINHNNHYNRNRIIALDFSNKPYEAYDKCEKFVKDFAHSNEHCLVSALEIKGDTRFDEAIYHLTREKLTGPKKTARDEILRFLSFRAGVAKAYLTFYGLAWGGNMHITNSHIGNFVVYSDNDLINVGITDLCGLRDESFFETCSSKSKPAFYEHVEKELKAFEDDLNEPMTCSLPTSIRYRNFSDGLRRECFNALKTGYALEFFAGMTLDKLILPQIKHERIVVPSRVNITEEEFRHECNRIVN